MAIIGNNQGNDNDHISGGHYGPYRSYRTSDYLKPGSKSESGTENNFVPGISRRPAGNGQNGEMSEDQRADANNAQNIRNLADAATTSGSPHAAAAGAAIKAADALTGGKASENLGKLATKVAKRVPGGRGLQKASNKAAESGLSDAATRLKTGKTPKNNSKPQSPNTGSDALKANKSRRHGRLWNMLNGNNSLGGGDSQSEESNEDSGGEESSASEEFLESTMRKVLIKIAVASAIVLFIVLLPLTAAVAIMGGDIVQAIPAVSPATYKTDSYQPITEEGTEERENEEAYYDKLEEYAKDGIKTSYIHATLLYKDMVSEEDDDNNGEYDIDYKLYLEKAEEVYKLMKGKNINYERHENFYNSLKNSSFFKEYYKDVIAKNGENGATIVLDEIFELAERIDDVKFEDDTVITDETKVTVKKEETESDKTSEKETDTKTMPVTDYISDSIYANTDDVDDSEMVKAYTVAYSTNIVSKNKKLTINSNEASMNNVTCSVKLGCSYDITGKLVDGPGIQSSKNTIFYKGHYYYKKPLEDAEIKKLNSDINSVMGNVITNKNGTYPSLDVSVIGKSNGKDYKSILASGYGSELNYKNIGEGSYDAGVEYGSGGEVFINIAAGGYFYEQKDFSNARFCGIKGYTIGGSGCGVTAMAMVASYYEKDKQFDPIYMNAEATKRKMCGGGSTGTKQAFFGSMAKAFKYGYVGLNKSDKVTPNTVISNLLKGHLIIARMGKGTFTGGGHYIVLAGVRPSTRQVYVYDPNNRNNSKYKGSGNGWYSFNNIILKEANNFYIIYKQEG